MNKPVKICKNELEVTNYLKGSCIYKFESTRADITFRNGSQVLVPKCSIRNINTLAKGYEFLKICDLYIKCDPTVIIEIGTDFNSMD